MILSNKIFFPSKKGGLPGVGFMGSSIFGYSDSRVNTIMKPLLGLALIIN